MTRPIAPSLSSWAAPPVQHVAEDGAVAREAGVVEVVGGIVGHADPLHDRP